MFLLAASMKWIGNNFSPIWVEERYRFWDRCIKLFTHLNTPYKPWYIWLPIHEWWYKGYQDFHHPFSIRPKRRLSGYMAAGCWIFIGDVGCCVGINLVAARVGKKMGVFVCLRMHVAGFGPVELFDSKHIIASCGTVSSILMSIHPSKTDRTMGIPDWNWRSSGSLNFIWGWLVEMPKNSGGLRYLELKNHSNYLNRHVWFSKKTGRTQGGAK